MVIALAEGVRESADFPAGTLARKHEETVASAAKLGFPPDRAAEVADDSWTALSEFADALVAVAEAARNVIAMSEKHAEELERINAHTD